jgi:NADH:ubiquinone oxidoreductase subunit F (NADH-binding)
VPLDEHLGMYGPLPVLEDEKPTGTIVRIVAESGLRGRGGAGYPVADKMRAVLATKGRPVVLVNGAAGDPLSEKDAFLITRVPHLVLDGAQAAAQAVGARQIVLCVAAQPRVYGAAERALAERRRADLDPVPVRLVPATDRYVAGEASALVQHVSGGAALPMFKPPHNSERGIKGRPTLVQNVETLANLALLVRYGALWFRGVGTPKEPGSLVLTVRGAVPRSVVIEVPVGTTVEQALAGAGWLTEPVGAILVGGCHGRWLPTATALSAPLSHTGLAAVGGTLGTNAVVALPEQACGLNETARLARYLAEESAGQCGSCLNGLPSIAAALTALDDTRADEATVQRLYEWCEMVTGQGACHHPDGTAALVRSALDVFSDEVGRHLGGWCSRPMRGVLPLPPAADQPVTPPGAGRRPAR